MTARARDLKGGGAGAEAVGSEGGGGGGEGEAGECEFLWRDGGPGKSACGGWMRKRCLCCEEKELEVTENISTNSTTSM